MSNGYFGVMGMTGEEGRDIRKLAKGIKAKKEAFLEGHAERGKWRGGKDFVKSLLDIFDPTDISGSLFDTVGEQIIQHNIGVEGGPDLSNLETMWTGGEATARDEYWDKKIEASDETLMGGLLRTGKDWLESKAGKETIGKFGEFVGDKFSDFGRGQDLLLDTGGEWGSNIPEGDYKEQMWRKGGRVPKYKNGGNVKPTGQRILDKLLTTDWGGYEASGAFEVERPEGKRWYRGKDTSRDMQVAIDKANMLAMFTAMENPADSLVTGGLPIKEVLAKLNAPEKVEEPKKKKRFGFFEQGGQVPQYYGGGSVSGNPSIANYFSAQGKTLGGSNTESVAEKLGMK